MSRRSLVRQAAGLSAAIAVVFGAQAQEKTFLYTEGMCGPLHNSFGPYDFRTIPMSQKALVEGAHFPPAVESLRQGHRSQYVGGDIDYTLRAIPNHPRALQAMVRLGKKERKAQPAGARYPTECYFDRALRFAPDDPWPKILYAIFLIDNNRKKEAGNYLSQIDQTEISDPQINYNLGLAHFELGNYQKSEEYAKRAYDAGITFPALREKLDRRHAR